MILKLMSVSMVRLCSVLARWTGSTVICSSYRNFVWSSTSRRKRHRSGCPLPVWGHDHLLLLQRVHARRFPEERLPRKWNVDTVSCVQRYENIWSFPSEAAGMGTQRSTWPTITVWLGLKLGLTAASFSRTNLHFWKPAHFFTMEAGNEVSQAHASKAAAFLTTTEWFGKPQLRHSL